MFCSAQVGTAQIRPVHASGEELCAPQVCPSQVRSAQVRLNELCIFQIRVSQVGPFQVCAAKICTVEIRPSQICPGPTCPLREWRLPLVVFISWCLPSSVSYVPPQAGPARQSPKRTAGTILYTALSFGGMFCCIVWKNRPLRRVVPDRGKTQNPVHHEQRARGKNP